MFALPSESALKQLPAKVRPSNANVAATATFTAAWRKRPPLRAPRIATTPAARACRKRGKMGDAHRQSFDVGCARRTRQLFLRQRSMIFAVQRPVHRRAVTAVTASRNLPSHSAGCGGGSLPQTR